MKKATMFSAALLVLGFLLLGGAMSSNTAPEAPSGFDNQTIDPNLWRRLCTTPIGRTSTRLSKPKKTG